MRWRNLVLWIGIVIGAAYSFPAYAYHTGARIHSFSASAAKTVRGQSLTLSWSTSEVLGVNLQFDCSDAVRVSAPAYSSAPLPCARPAFTDPLSANTSLDLRFTNSASDDQPLRMLLLPSLETGTYEGTHAVSLSVTVATDRIPDPVISFFTASSASVASAASTTLAWSVRNAAAANILIGCRALATVATSSAAGALSCDAYAFSPNLSTDGTAILHFFNTAPYGQQLSLTLVPVTESGGYDLVRSRELIITVLPPGAAVAPPAVLLSLAPVALPIAAPSAIPVAGTAPAISKQPVFTAYLSRGLRHGQARLLQQFFTKDAAVYPEGLVTGYFGPATERAVQRFQKKYGIADIGQAGYGVVGPKTRAKLNALY